MYNTDQEIKYGGVIPPEIGSDWIRGVNSQIAYEARCDEWARWLSSPENQYTNRGDFMNCVSQSFVDNMEIQLNWLVMNKFSKKQIDELEALGYINSITRKKEISPRALGKMSGTTRQGNSQNKVAETARLQGLIPKSDWDIKDGMTWDEYYAEIPQSLLDKAKKILDYITINYEWIVTDGSNPQGDYAKINEILAKEVKQAPIQITFPICPAYRGRQSNPSQPIMTCNLISPEHAADLYDVKLDDLGRNNRYIRDSYPPYNIIFANNYPIPYALKILATPLS